MKLSLIIFLLSSLFNQNDGFAFSKSRKTTGKVLDVSVEKCGSGTTFDVEWRVRDLITDAAGSDSRRATEHESCYLIVRDASGESLENVKCNYQKTGSYQGKPGDKNRVKLDISEICSFSRKFFEFDPRAKTVEYLDDNKSLIKQIPAYIP
jgi:hypothetical protein